jgi:16S rRNA (cytosine1402-N4)-methyltransferase
MSSAFHEPVLRDETLQHLFTIPGGTYVDCTVGGGGHAAALCARLDRSGRLICFDADAEALEQARVRLASCPSRVEFVHENYRHLAAVLRRLGAGPVQGILFDLGVSSHQLDETSRGFSFRSDAPLDMRMDRRASFTARELVNTASAEELEVVIREYGEERFARRIARAIVRARPLETTGALRDSVAGAVRGPMLTKTLARVYQALRIAVNDELRGLGEALRGAVDTLAPGGRIVVIAYHSLEDRIVKELFRGASATYVRAAVPMLPDTPVEPRLRVLTRRPVVPGEAETAANPRARSARLRAAERTTAT